MRLFGIDPDPYTSKAENEDSTHHNLVDGAFTVTTIACKREINISRLGNNNRRIML